MAYPIGAELCNYRVSVLVGSLEIIQS